MLRIPAEEEVNYKNSERSEGIFDKETGSVQEGAYFEVEGREEAVLGSFENSSE